MQSLKILFPDPEYVSLAGRKVLVKPVTFKNFEQFGKSATVVIAMASAKSTEELYAYARRTDHLERLLTSSTNLSRWRIRRLPAAAAVHLMLHVIRVNAFFFEAALIDMAQVLDGQTSPQA